jgi:chemotaxis protein CheY-P-specific phosphatase CheC
MKIADLKAAMTASISEVLETMFYMPLEFEDIGDPESRGLFDLSDLRVCRLEFKGKLNGSVVMLVPENLLVSMAVDFMGENKENITRVHTDGIIKEAANMIVGHMLSNLDDKSDFHLGIPSVIDEREYIDVVRKKIHDCYVLAESIEGLLLSVLILED